jgi:cytochrome P450
MPRFTPRAIRSRHEEIDRIAVEVLDEVAASPDAGEFDFVERIAAPLPIGVISWILGVPRHDWQLLFRWTNEIIGKDDPEFRQPGESPGQTIRRARIELHTYLSQLIERRRDEPGDDIVSHLLASEIDGNPLTESQLLNYCELIVEAGNETTRNAISGGLLAFAEHPDQWELLKKQPELLPTAVDEILRWVSPIIHFTRTATEDSVLHGQTIRTGDRVALFYASANRDEEVFTDPFEFRVDRQPNHHLAFGSGAHFCMGAHLARVELEAVYRHLLDRLDSFELAAPPERLNSAVNGGIKHLPLRCHLA